MQTPPCEDEIEVSIFGPGFGESIVVHTGYNQWIIVDSCRFRSGEDCAAVEYFNQLPISPDVTTILATHWHDDHIMGLTQALKKYQDAKLVVSSAIRDKKFANVILESPLGKERRVGSSTGVYEIKEIFELLKSSSRKAGIAIINADIYHNKKSDCLVRAVSPDDSVSIQSTINLIEAAVAENPSLASIKTIKPNDISVALQISCCGTSILLGADLERSGWDLVVENGIGLLKSDLYKVSHHGAVSGHCDQMWEMALADKPISVVAPFNRGAKLPTDDDLNRILGASGAVYITSRGAQKAKRYSDDKHVNESLAKKNATFLHSKYGQIRLRKKIGASSPWSVELFGTAECVAA